MNNKGINRTPIHPVVCFYKTIALVHHGKRKKRKERKKRDKIEDGGMSNVDGGLLEEGEGVSKNLSLLLVQETPQPCEIWMIFTRKRRGEKRS